MDQNKIDNLDEQQLHKLSKLISKRRNNLSKKSPPPPKKKKKKKKKTRKNWQKSITKIVPSTNKAYESFNVDIINNTDPQVQLHQLK